MEQSALESLIYLGENVKAENMEKKLGLGERAFGEKRIKGQTAGLSRGHGLHTR